MLLVDWISIGQWVDDTYVTLRDVHILVEDDEEED